MLRKIFIEHPESVNETYLEHFAASYSFGGQMIAAGLACLVHGLIPCLFTHTGSNRVRALYDRMVLNRVRQLDRDMRPADGAR